MKTRNVACVLISKRITERFVQCLELPFHCQLLPNFNVQVRNSSFCLQFAIDIAENRVLLPRCIQKSSLPYDTPSMLGS